MSFDDAQRTSVNVLCVGGEKNSNAEWDPKPMTMFWGQKCAYMTKIQFYNHKTKVQNPTKK